MRWIPVSVAHAFVVLCFAGPCAAAGLPPQQCRVVVDKEWIIVGNTSLAACLNYARQVATPDRWQYAKLGGTYLKVMGSEQLQSGDGGNTWQAVGAAGAPAVSAAAAPGSGVESGAETAEARYAPPEAYPSAPSGGSTYQERLLSRQQYQLVSPQLATPGEADTQR